MDVFPTFISYEKTYLWLNIDIQKSPNTPTPLGKLKREQSWLSPILQYI